MAGACAGLVLGACGLAPVATGGAGGSPLEVAAAENFWGSIATQVGGSHVRVRSIVVNPDTDPHAYEATPRDARTFAGARYVIVNGVGYDPWAVKLLAANPVAGRRELNVGELVGKKAGENPHLWYSAAYVGRVVDRVTEDLKKIDPAHAAYFDQHGAAYRNIALKDYFATVQAIKQKYAGSPVGATESIFVYTAQATGLSLVTPADYMKAISEGTDPNAGDKIRLNQQVAGGVIKVLVFNSQNTSPDVKAVVAKATARKIPVVAVTETLSPAGATFQEWQTSQLKALLEALGG
ncbi:MAG TPA: zinc ABC transporter substrate-binding protein [Candidatus Dormibacteraeota bacterium]|nr:zinc ABC transporter substrate-binding protein [Candidatus Dormibacteraeota bacterium]